MAAFGDFNEVLAAILGGGGDKARMDQAETVIDDLLKNQPENMASNLLQAMKTAPSQELREIACVLFRRYLWHIGGEELSMWPRCSPVSREAIKQELIAAIKTPQETTVRHKMADCISSLIKAMTVEISNQTQSDDLPPSSVYWPGLLEELWQWTQSGNPFLLEAALQIFSSVPGIFGDNINRYAQPLFAMLQSALQHDNFDVQVAASRAFVGLLSVLTKQLRSNFSSLTPIVIQLVAKCLIQGRTDGGLVTLQSLIEIAEDMPKFLRPHAAEIIDSMAQIAQNQNVDEACRKAALEMCVSLAESAPGMVRKVPGFGEKMIPVVLQMLKELEDDDDWSKEDELDSGNDEEDVSAAAELALDRLSMSLGGAAILPTAFALLPNMLKSADWKDRHAACFAISSLAEGAVNQMRDSLPAVVQQVMPLLNDEVGRVRYAACNCLGQLAIDFAPANSKEIGMSFQGQFHGSVIPALLETIQKNAEGHPRVAAHAMAALINVCEHSTKKILAPYMDPLLTTVSHMLGSRYIIVQESAISCLATVADSARKLFCQYYSSFMPQLKAIIMNATQPEHKMLRAKTFECATLVGLAVGKEMFAADGQEIMQALASSQNIESDDPQVTYMLSSWARICQILGQDFLPYLEYVLPPLLHSAELSPEIRPLEHDEDLSDLPDSGDNWELLSIDDQQIGIKTSVLEEKRCACEMLIIYAKELGGAFAPVVERVAPNMIKLMKFYFEEGVRIAAARIQSHLIKALLEGSGVQAAQALWAQVFPPLVKVLKDEPDLEVLAEQLAALRDCICVLGENGINNQVLTDCTDVILEVLGDYGERCELRHKTRTEDEDHDEHAEETLSEEEKLESDVIREVAELIHTVFGYAKTAFVPFFDKIADIFTQMLQPHRLSHDHQWALCVFDDLIENGGEASLKYANVFAEAMIGHITDHSYEVRQAACYGVGAMALTGMQHYVSVCQAALPKLLEVIRAPGSRESPNTDATENAISAFVKIARNPAMGVDQNMLVDALCEWLPITEDDEEGEYVYGYVCELLESNNPAIMQDDKLVKIGKAFATVVGTSMADLESALGQRMAGLLQTMMTNPALQQQLIEFFHAHPDINARMESALTGGVAHA